jgi:hypothetical protein
MRGPSFGYLKSSTRKSSVACCSLRPGPLYACTTGGGASNGRRASQVGEGTGCGAHTLTLHQSHGLLVHTPIDACYVLSDKGACCCLELVSSAAAASGQRMLWLAALDRVVSGRRVSLLAHHLGIPERCMHVHFAPCPASQPNPWPPYRLALKQQKLQRHITL